MGKRIFRNMVLIAILTVLLSTAVIVPSLYTAHENRMSSALRQEAGIIADALELAEDDPVYLEQLDTESRISLISADGTVLFDSAADAARMENHADRPEFVQALESGSGESTRASETLAETTIYYALRMENGAVLRISDTRSSMLGTFLKVLPMIAGMLLCIVLIAFLIARQTARRIVKPINELNLDDPLENDAYDELAPLLTRMERQHIQIHQHVKALENARAELAAIMDNMREGMILLDKNSAILSMNKSAMRIFGVSEEEHIGRNLLSVSRDADLHDLAAAALRGEGGNLMMNRNNRHYRIYASPVIQQAKVRGVVLLVLDVTERFAAEESRREFTANVSHELKTPLTSISGFAEIIRDGIAQPQDIHHFAGMICKESARLIALVNDILELSQLDEKQNLGQKVKVFLMPMLRSLSNDFAIPAQKKNLTLTLSGDAAEVEGYPTLLREMFFNLIDNAIKYTPEGGKIAVSVENTEKQLVCRVSDNGIGIPKEHQAHVFERFYRVDKSHSRQTGGTGLGLAIVKHVAQIHGAEIHLDSQPGRGTKIGISFKV
ncbi:MAG: PAS domain S-box protein [Clostridia bacterium]|nr:PAS domain S-box protein [Clostridia bacterium]